jgi:hypothetical protein
VNLTSSMWWFRIHFSHRMVRRVAFPSGCLAGYSKNCAAARGRWCVRLRALAVVASDSVDMTEPMKRLCSS